MKVTGITAEYNPLHKGHEYHIAETKKRTGCDALVVAMSGDYVQRGEPAVTDKWTRAAMALDAGADLVIEIPVLFSLGNALGFARAAVTILEEAGCSTISFGSESGDIEMLLKISGMIKASYDEISAGISALVSEGLSYPSARTRVYAEMRKLRDGAPASEINRELAVLSDPNDILALEYLMQMKKAEPVAVLREGDGYSQTSAGGNGFASAAAVRNSLYNGEDIAQLVPSYAHERLMSGDLTFSDEWTGILRYALMSSGPDSIEDCPSGGEGLGNLLKAAAHKEDSWDGMISAAKSKRYTYTRISRLCMQAVLGITRSSYPYEEPLYLRVLGFSGKGRELLSELRSDSGRSLPVITNINKESGNLSYDARKMLGLDVHSSDIYNLVTGRDTATSSDHVMRPVMK